MTGMVPGSSARPACRGGTFRTGCKHQDARPGRIQEGVCVALVPTAAAGTGTGPAVTRNRSTRFSAGFGENPWLGGH
jgi:hypothetical protein